MKVKSEAGQGKENVRLRNNNGVASDSFMVAELKLEGCGKCSGISVCVCVK